jgi:hypothetical protein
MILSGLILLAFLGGYGYLRSAQTNPPQIEITPASHDFGDIPYHKVETDFQVRNAGGSMLEILSVSTSCGCTTAEIGSKALTAGQTAQLHVTFDPTLMGEKGDILRMVYVKSNDPDRPEAEIELRGNVVQSPSEKP